MEENQVDLHDSKRFVESIKQVRLKEVTVLLPTHLILVYMIN